MYLIYAFIAFLFFKIFPELAAIGSNTVIGASVMAVTSALILFGSDVYASMAFLRWQTRDDVTPRSVGVPWKTYAILTAGIPASCLSTYLIAGGFSSDLFRRSFMGFRPNPTMFFVMAALPAASVVILRIGVIRKAEEAFRRSLFGN